MNNIGEKSGKKDIIFNFFIKTLKRGVLHVKCLRYVLCQINTICIHVKKIFTRSISNLCLGHMEL